MHQPASAGPPGYQVTLAPLPAREPLRDAWLSLQARSDSSFFLSWQWIGTWLDTICPTRMARLLSVAHHGRVVAMGIVTRRGRLFGLAPASLRLHETGSRDLDSLTIEYNGLLSETGHQHHALAAMVCHLLEHEPRWLTIYLPGIDVDALPLAALREMPVDIRMNVRPTPFVDLQALRDRGLDYLPTLGSKTRAAVRRTARRFEQAFGPITLETAASPGQRLEYFHALVAHHQRYWRGRNGSDGAFGDPRVVRFHERLLGQSPPTAGGELMKLSAGDTPIGYAYNIVSKGTAHFYQSGIDYAAGGFHGSPGLLLLSRVIERHQEEGTTRFELMAGDSPYKRSLGAQAGTMAWASIDRIGFAARLRRVWWRLDGRGD